MSVDQPADTCSVGGHDKDGLLFAIYSGLLGNMNIGSGIK